VLPVLDAARQGFELVFSWPNILYPTLATFIAMAFAFLPGLSGVTLMALAISVTFSWDPLHIMLIFGAFTGGATFMGSITAIVFNIPGTAPSAATMIDGHPMSRMGKARTAIGCAATASALGSTIGVLLLILLIPVLRTFILAFGPAEFLMLAIWGLATIAALTGPSLVKGLGMAGIGLLLAFIGMDRRTAELRFTFGALDLQDGINVVPAFLGVFAIAQMLELTVSGRESISGGAILSGSPARRCLCGIPALRAAAPQRDYRSAHRHDPGHWRHGGEFYRLRPSRSNIERPQPFRPRRHPRRHCARGGARCQGWRIARAHARLRNSRQRGHGRLLAALTLHGFVPGPELLKSQLPMAFVLIWSLFYSNWLTSIVGVLLARPLASMSEFPDCASGAIRPDVRRSRRLLAARAASAT
jgi:TctA family transporter